VERLGYLVMETHPTREESLRNPGGIEHEGLTVWLGQTPDQPDPVFVQFEDMAHGIRAIIVTLRTYQEHDGVKTYAGAINRWAPPQSNDTAAYIEDVCTRCQVQPGDDLAVTVALIQAIVIHENGPGTIVTADDINAGFALLGG
jgi:hypothetical protein